ncbi:thiol:disulfide interchange protein DsbC [Vibrio parahaemolyticus AQ3810]|nr:thiol:disulfide interchange protein DsbC [Vibrio parahaemolyticus AQ3810]
MSIIDIQPSDVAGLLEIQTNGGILFASNNGDHFIAGTLYAIDDNGGYKDVLAERQAPLNAEKIAKFADSMIEYKAFHFEVDGTSDNIAGGEFFSLIKIWHKASAVWATKVSFPAHWGHSCFLI